MSWSTIALQAAWWAPVQGRMGLKKAGAARARSPRRKFFCFLGAPVFSRTPRVAIAISSISARIHHSHHFRTVLQLFSGVGSDGARVGPVQSRRWKVWTFCGVRDDADELWRRVSLTRIRGGFKKGGAREEEGTGAEIGTVESAPAKLTGVLGRYARRRHSAAVSSVAG